MRAINLSRYFCTMSYQLTSAEVTTIHQLVNDAERILITSHKSPDGDAIGSSLALFHVLVGLGKKPQVILPDGVPSSLQFLQGYDTVITYEQHPEQVAKQIENAQLIFSLDYNHLGRVGSEMEAHLRKATCPFILIDHHQLPEPFAKVTYSDTSSCSTAELIYKTIVQCGWRHLINIPTAEGIYTGIMTDSGSFRFPSVTAETHTIVASLIQLGLNHAHIHRQVYDTNSYSRMKLVGYALSEKLEIIEHCDTAIISLSLYEMERFHHQPGDTESLVNQALSIKGIKLSAFFREEKDKVKISFRSKGTFDVNTFARQYWQGGGHVNAAGGSSQLSLADTLTQFRQQCLSMKDTIIQS